MPRVLVLAASGFVGKPIALAFERRGYTVYGLTRAQEKAKVLAQHEIIPVVGQAQDVQTWLPIAEQSDVIVEAIADYQSRDTAGIVAKALIELLHRKPHITVIYTSGTWVYGPSKDVVDEHTPTNPIGLVAWRPTVEDLYTKAGATVVRPGLVYGASGSLTSFWFKQIQDGKITLAPGQIASVVHTEDLAELYVLIALHPTLSRGQTFNGTAYVESVIAFAESAKRAINPTLNIETTLAPAPGSLEEGTSLHQVVSSAKAKTLLGWNPTRPQLVAGVTRYYNAWKALSQ